MKKKKNAGFSLIEIVIGLAIASIVGTLVSSFMLFGLKSYGKTTDEVSLQEKAQITLSQMNNYIMDGDYVTYWITTDNGVRDQYVNDIQATGNNPNADMLVKEIWVLSTDKYGNQIYDILGWQKDDKKIYYLQTEANAINPANPLDFSNEELLANNVEDFSADLQNLDVREVYLTMDMAKNQKLYSAERTVHLRNTLRMPSQPNTPGGTNPTEITSVEITPVVVERLPGETCVFQAKVYPDIAEFQNVEWTYYGNSSTGTNCEPNNNNPMYAVCDLGLDETGNANKEIKVRATAKDPSSGALLQDVYAEATIIVKEPTPQVEVLEVEVTPNPVTKYKGETQQFTAVVKGNNNPPQTVDWSVEGKKSANTYISSNGLLTIGEDEESETLIVRATSTYRPENGSIVSGTATCYVKAPLYLGDGVVIYENSCMLNCNYYEDPDNFVEQVQSLPVLDKIQTYYKTETLLSPSNDAKTALQNKSLAQYSAGELIINNINYDITTPAIIAQGNLKINVSQTQGELVIGSPDEPVLLASLNGAVIFNVPSGVKVTIYGIIYMPNSGIANNQVDILELHGLIISKALIYNPEVGDFYQLESVSGEGGLLEKLSSTDMSTIVIKNPKDQGSLKENGQVISRPKS